MIKQFLKEKIKNILNYNEIKRKQNVILKNIGLIISNLNKKKNFDEINKYEFQIFSQFGDDGIIQFLINKIELDYKYHNFIEIVNVYFIVRMVLDGYHFFFRHRSAWKIFVRSIDIPSGHGFCTWCFQSL